MLYGLVNTISHVSLHNGLPTQEKTELFGGVYRRKQIDFLNPETGEARTQAEIYIEVPEGARVTHAGFWTSSIGGTLLAWGKTTVHQFRGRGVYVIDLAKMSIYGEIPEE